MTEATIKWNEQNTAELLNIVGNETPVSKDKVIAAATMIEGMTERRVAAKLRKLGMEVVSLAKQRVAAFTDDEGSQLEDFVNENSGELTYADIAEKFLGGKFNAKQVQGKILHLELTSHVKPSEPVVHTKTYSDAEEAEFIKLANSGSTMEQIAEAIDKGVPSCRGKALSLLNAGLINSIPALETSTAKTDVDIYGALGEAIHGMTVEEISEKLGKTPRGVKSSLTHRGIKVANYDGEAKKAKGLAKQESAA